MKQYKLAVTVPQADGDMLRQVIGDAGGGKVGNYSHCSFTTNGVGRFTPQNGAQPAIGVVGQPEAVAEERIEVNCDETSLEPVLAAIRQYHPYEEPAIDVYSLLNI